jgi:catechol 2,3-dioxygenase-like lactoylglutathione lyase family enzyme
MPGPQPTVSVTSLDHIVLKCVDVERTTSWYVDVLGLEAVRLEEWRRQEVPFPSVRVDPTTIIDLIAAADVAAGVTAADDLAHDLADGRLDHFCLVIDPVDFDELAASGRFDVVAGPGRRFGARGEATSLYVRDPDGAVVELRYY